MKWIVCCEGGGKKRKRRFDLWKGLRIFPQLRIRQRLRLEPNYRFICLYVGVFVVSYSYNRMRKIITINVVSSKDSRKSSIHDLVFWTGNSFFPNNSALSKTWASFKPTDTSTPKLLVNPFTPPSEFKNFYGWKINYLFIKKFILMRLNIFQKIKLTSLLVSPFKESKTSLEIESFIAKNLTFKEII